jgi:hypothetical protein
MKMMNRVSQMTEHTICMHTLFMTYWTDYNVFICINKSGINLTYMVTKLFLSWDALCGRRQRRRQRQQREMPKNYYDSFDAAAVVRITFFASPVLVLSWDQKQKSENNYFRYWSRNICMEERHSIPSVAVQIVPCTGLTEKIFHVSVFCTPSKEPHTRSG